MRAYAEKMKDARWQKKRLEVLTSANWTCEACGVESQKTGDTMHIHHKFYGFAKKREPWEYERHELMAVCADCHEKMPRGNEEWESLVSQLCRMGLKPPLVRFFSESIFMLIFDIATLLYEDEFGRCHLGGNDRIQKIASYIPKAMDDFIESLTVLSAGHMCAMAINSEVRWQRTLDAAMNDVDAAGAGS